MEDKIIPLNKETQNAFLELQHKFYEEYQSVMKEYDSKYMILRKENLDFLNELIRNIGIIAGFGFLGISLVKQIIIFSVGELFLMSSLLYGIYSLKNIYKKSLQSIMTGHDNISVLYKNKSDVFQKYNPLFFQNRELNLTKFWQEHEDKTKSILSYISTHTDEGKGKQKNKDESQFLNIVLIFTVVGILFILLSFFKHLQLFIKFW